MRISQLITRLQEIQSQLGDLEVNNAEAVGRDIQHRYPGRVWVRTIREGWRQRPVSQPDEVVYTDRRIVVFPVTGEPIS